MTPLHRLRLLLSVTFGLATAAAPTRAGAQERLILESFGDESLHRLGLAVHDEKPVWQADVYGGVEGTLARGAAPAEDRPFALTAGFGVGVRRNVFDLLQIRSQASVPLPFGLQGGAGPMRIWDIDGAHRLRAQLGLGGIDGDHLEKGRGGADFEVEGSLWQGGAYGTSFMRRDIGPYPFFDAGARATVSPRFAMQKDIGLVLPVSAEVRHVEVDRPEGIFAYTSERVSSGIGPKVYTEAFSHGWYEVVGAGWERVSFMPPAGAPRPRLGGVERMDLRFLHPDGMLFSPERDIELDLSMSLGGNWLQDPTAGSKASLAAFAGSLSGSIRGYPDHGEGKEAEVVVGAGVVRDATFMADGSALTRRVRLEAWFDTVLLDGRVGGSLRSAGEQLQDVGPKDPFHVAVAAEWFLSPIRPLELGVHYTSTQQCVSAATAAGPAWCHRFGLFLRATQRWSRTTTRKGD